MSEQIAFEFEEWRIIPFAAAYEVSSHGRIRRVDGASGTVAGRIRKLTPDKDGYLQVVGSMRDKRITIKVHRAVLLAFKGPPPTTEYLSSHEDGDNSNNFASNLEWRTQPENLKLKIKHGTHGRGIKIDQVRSIRAMRSKGHTYKEISDFHSVAFSTVAHIVTRRTWAHDHP
jgi:NUMOD4 motif